MYISHKSNNLFKITDVEWDCRRQSKGLSKSKYWAWEETIKDSDGVPDYSGESGYTIVECTDENVWERLAQLDDYVSIKPEGSTYNIKYYASKRDSEIVDVPAHKDEDGKDVAATYVQSHFIGDDTAKDKRILDQKWADIRERRNRLLTESDWVDYRTELRDITKQSDPDDITWPTKP